MKTISVRINRFLAEDLPDQLTSLRRNLRVELLLFRSAKKRRLEDWERLMLPYFVQAKWEEVTEKDLQDIVDIWQARMVLCRILRERIRKAIKERPIQEDHVEIEVHSATAYVLREVLAEVCKHYRSELPATSIFEETTRELLAESKKSLQLVHEVCESLREQP